jgi:hypothetical protein
MCSNEWPAFVGLWSSEGTSSVSFRPSVISSGSETGRVVVIRFNGVVGGGGAADSTEEPLDIRLAVLDSGESTLADRP